MKIRRSFTRFHAALFLVFIGLNGCSKVGQARDFGKDLSDVTAEITNRIDAQPTANGVADARSYFSGKKADLQAKFEKLASVKLDEAAKSELLTKVVDNQVAMTKLMSTHLAQAHSDRAFSESLSALTKEFDAAFDPSLVK